jgi:hypothetical protein
MKSQWMEYKGRQFFYGDVSNLKTNVNDLATELNASTQIIMQQPEKSVRMIVDLRNTIISPDAARVIKDNIDQTNRYICKGAIVGLTRVRKAVFDIFSKLASSEVVSFDSIDEAKEWLMK